MKLKEEFMFNEQFETIAKNCEENGYVIPSWCFKTTDGKLKYAAYMYFNDKKEYLSTKKWPTKKFWQRDMIWTYYYYLQITDYSIDLEKYLNFSYDTNKWTKEDLIRLMLKYGTNVLFNFSVYQALNTNESFDEWYSNYQDDNNYLDSIREKLDEFNTFKTIRK